MVWNEIVAAVRTFLLALLQDRKLLTTLCFVWLSRLQHTNITWDFENSDLHLLNQYIRVILRKCYHNYYLESIFLFCVCWV